MSARTGLVSTVHADAPILAVPTILGRSAQPVWLVRISVRAVWVQDVIPGVVHEYLEALPPLLAQLHVEAIAILPLLLLLLLPIHVVGLLPVIPCAGDSERWATGRAQVLGMQWLELRHLGPL